MTLWDILLVWLVAQLWPGGKGGPKWPEPKGPTGPTGPTGPGPTGPGPTGPTGPMGGTTWKPYFYIQPDAGKEFGTPYALASEWHGKGSSWTELYNFTQNRPIAEAVSASLGLRDSILTYNWQFGKTKTKKGGEMGARTVVVHLSSADEVWVSPDDQTYIAKCIETGAYSGDNLNAQRAAIGAKLRAAKAGGAAYGSVIAGEPSQQSQPAPKSSANVGDKLLVPWTWPEPKAKAILDRLEPIPAGTALPGVQAKVTGDEDASTI